MKQSKKLFWTFLMPSLVSFLLVAVIPMFIGIFYSFTDWNGMNNQINFVGFQNYIKILTNDPGFINAFVFTLKYAVVEVILVNVCALALALFITSKYTPFSGFFKGAFFLPNLIGGILLGFIWQFIFTKGFSSIAATFNLPFFDKWLSTTQTGFLGLIIVSSWQSIGYMMLIYIAGLTSISEEVLEAASIDGVVGFKKLKYITLPLLMPTVTVGLFMNIAGAFKVFDQNLSLTSGGPYNSTQMISLNIYNTAYTYNDLGAAQAKAIIFLIVVGCIAFIELYLTKRNEVEI